MKNILGLSGKDSLVAALLLKTHNPELYKQLEIFTTYTGFEYPETIEWINTIEQYLEKTISIIDGDLPGIIESYKKTNEYFLPSQQARYCTRESKLKPFEKWLNNEKAYLYTGIRYDENRIGYKSNNKVIAKFPLHDYKIDIGKVYSIIFALEEKYRPPTFFWQELYDATVEQWNKEFPLLENAINKLTQIQKILLFSGRTRPNCFVCFNQRQYEIVWLKHTYPELFEKMKDYEGDYTWLNNFRLSELTLEKENEIIIKRAKQIVSQVSKQIFCSSDNMFDGMNSCGLFCGK